MPLIIFLGSGGALLLFSSFFLHDASTINSIGKGFANAHLGRLRLFLSRQKFRESQLITGELDDAGITY